MRKGPVGIASRLGHLLLFAALMVAAGSARATPLPCSGTTCTVTSGADLAAAIATVNGNPGSNYTINIVNGVTLSGGTALPPIITSSTVTINGDGNTLDGNHATHGFFVYAGTVAINNLAIQNTVARGGGASVIGNGGGGGGGLGAGGAVFVNSGAHVTLSGVNFSGNAAVGGSGGNTVAGNGLYAGGGGGGGIFGNGGSGGNGGGGGGGGLAGNGGVGAGPAGGGGLAGNGGGGFVLGGGGGGGQIGAGMSGGAGGNGGGGGAPNGGVGGAGAFIGNGGNGTAGGVGGGGGGGGSGLFFGAGGNGGAGGSFGGGGGGGIGILGGGTGGNGGPGGGGGGGGLGGAGTATGKGGLGGNFGGGGGGGTGAAGGGGGFGAGGGGNGAGLGGAGGLAGFGGGNGGAGGTFTGSGGLGGDGGSAFGGAVFVRQGGALIIADGSIGASNTVTAGLGGLGPINGMPGSASGGALYLDAGVAATYQVAGGSQTAASDIAGPGSLGKTGAGTLVLGAANSYTGGTALNAGALVLGNAAALGAGALTMAAGTTLQFTPSGLAIANPIALAGDPTIDTGANNETLSGVISGSGSLIKAGTGTLTLTGAETYSGATTIDAGTLALGPGGALTASSGVALAAAGTVFDISGGGNQTIADLSGVAGSGVALGANTLILGTANSTIFAGVISGSGGLVKQGSGTLTLSGVDTYTGGTALSAGTLAVGNNAALGAGTLTMAAGTTLQAADGLVLGNAVVLAGADTIDTQSHSPTLAGVVSGSGSLSKIGTGTLILTGANTYTGGTALSAGTLAVGSNTALGVGALTMAAGTTLQAAADGLVLGNAVVLGGADTIDTQSRHLTLRGAVSGGGSLTKTGTGKLTLTGAETYTGATTVNAGTLALGPGGSLAASGVVVLAAAGTMLDVSGGGNQTIGDLSGVADSEVMLGARTLTLGTANSTTFAGVVSGGGGLVKQGTGALTLTGTDTYRGATVIKAGTLALEPGGSLAASSRVALAAAGAGFDISGGGNQTIRDLTGVSGTIVNLGANTLTFGTADRTRFAGAFTGTGGLVKQGSGTFTLTGDSSGFAGNTVVEDGSLAIGSDASPNAGLGGNVALSGGTVTGFGTIGGNLANLGGVVAPGGSIGTLTVKGSYFQGANAALRIEVSPTAASRLAVGGGAHLVGTLALLYEPGVYTARAYTILTASAVSGNFAKIIGQVPTTGLSQALAYDPTDVQLQLTGAPTPAPAPPIVIAPTDDTIYTADTSTLVLNGQRMNGIILDRLGARQAGIADGPMTTGGAGLAPPAATGNLAAIGRIAEVLPQEWAAEGAWFRGVGGFAALNGNAGAPGFTGTAGGFLAGIDRPVARDLTLGLAGAICTRMSTSTRRAAVRSILRASRSMAEVGWGRAC
jgi:fibronectin-binding autotransporter adhesin